MIESGTWLKPASTCAYQFIDGKALLVSTRDRRLHWLDEIGADLWRFVEPGRTFAEIVDFLEETYEVDRARAESDAREFFTELLANRLIESSSR